MKGVGNRENWTSARFFLSTIPIANLKTTMKSTHYSHWCVPIIIGLLAFSLPMQGAVIYQSATLGPPDDQGWIVDASQYLGTRFTLTQTTQVDAIGGDMYASLTGPLWGAIVPLSGPTALPSGNPLNSALASVTFTLPLNQEADYSIPLSVQLQPGTYGLIFGAQDVNTSYATMPYDNVEIPGQASYFVWIGVQDAWRNGVISDTRFVVYGEAVPEPGMPVLFALLFGITAVLKAAKSSPRRVAMAEI